MFLDLATSLIIWDKSRDACLVRGVDYYAVGPGMAVLLPSE